MIAPESKTTNDTKDKSFDEDNRIEGHGWMDGNGKTDAGRQPLLALI